MVPASWCVQVMEPPFGSNSPPKISSQEARVARTMIDLTFWASGECVIPLGPRDTDIFKIQGQTWKHSEDVHKVFSGQRCDDCHVQRCVTISRDVD